MYKPLLTMSEITERRREIIKSLAQVAWADGELVEAEKKLLADILIKIGCKPEEIKKIENNPVKSTTALAQLDKVLPTHVERRSALRDLITLAFCDGECCFHEFLYIERMAHKLGVSSQELEELRDQALQFLNTQE